LVLGNTVKNVEQYRSAACKNLRALESRRA